MKKIYYIVLFFMVAPFLFSACNDEWTEELYEHFVSFKVPFLEVVKKDNPPFAEKGVISFSVPQKGYAKAKKRITKYLEDLILKELKNEIV